MLLANGTSSTFPQNPPFDPLAGKLNENKPPSLFAGRSDKQCSSHSFSRFRPFPKVNKPPLLLMLMLLPGAQRTCLFCFLYQPWDLQMPAAPLVPHWPIRLDHIRPVKSQYHHLHYMAWPIYCKPWEALVGHDHCSEPETEQTAEGVGFLWQ